MQKLVDFESKILGIPTIPVTADMIGKYTLGTYDNATDEMWINTEHLAEASVDACIQTVCHEVFHSFEFFLVSNIDWENPAINTVYFDELRTWMQNQSNYKSAWTYGFDEYENQPLEVAASEYAAEETARIMSYVNNKKIHCFTSFK